MITFLFLQKKITQYIDRSLDRNGFPVRRNYKTLQVYSIVFFSKSETTNLTGEEITTRALKH